MMEKRLEQIRANLPQLSLAERDRRWKKIREEMALRELDCLLIWNVEDSFGCASANYRYVTCLRGPAVALFPREGDPLVWASLPNISGYLRGAQSWIQDIRPSASAGDIALALKERGWERGNIGILSFGSLTYRMVTETVPYQPFLRLQKALPEAKFSGESAILERLRMIKSPEEIAFLEKAAELAYLMFQALVKTAKPGAKECELVANMTHSNLANGGEPTMIILDSGNPPLLHGRHQPFFTTRSLEKGDIIITEYHSNYSGYQIGIEHSISLGEPRKEYKDIHRVCEECFHQGVKALHPGTPLEQVERAFRTPAEEAGMTHIELGIHGHGLSSPEFPTFVFGGKGGLVQGHGMGKLAPIDIQENMVFGTNIDINNPKWSNESGLMLGDTILVTKDGPRKLSRVPVEFTVV